MKKFTFLVLLWLIAFSTAFSQSGNNFKNTSKKQSGSTITNLSYKSISNSSNLKNGFSNNPNVGYKVSKTLTAPGLNQQILKNIKYQKGRPIFFEIEKNQLKSATNGTAEEQFYSFHTASLQKTQINDPQKELLIKNISTDKNGITHVKAQQFYKGIKVYGAESFVHFGAEKVVFNGNIYPIDENINTRPQFAEKAVLQVAEQDLRLKTSYRNLSEKEKEILEYESPDRTLVIFENTLAYEISIRPNFIEEWKYFIDANNGNIIQSFNNTKSDGPTTASAYDLNNNLRTINTYLENGSYYLIDITQDMYVASTQEGVIYTYDAHNTNMENVSLAISSNNTWDDRAAVSAHYYAAETYNYLKNTFNRNSLNDKGGNILAIVNLSDENGGGYDNAYWNGKYIAFGTGSTYFKNLAGGLDVVAHEIGHGVVENTANLEYYGQSGAINETFADIFGAMVDRDNWQIGEDITNTIFSPSGTMRDMASPHNQGTSSDNYWQPNHTSEMYTGEGDNGGVHINSGIGNHAFYLFATATSKEKAEQVFYGALSNYLTTKSQFIDLRIAAVQSAKDLYGSNSQEVVVLVNAFEQVGIYDDSSVDYEQDYQSNPGQEYILSYDTDPANSNTLYRSSTTGENFFALTTTEMKGSVSVSDDGSAATFVATDDKIKVISTDPDNMLEDYLSDEAFFDNVALSKDGNRLAAISTEIDTAIYVYDFVTNEWAMFILYNPTTSHSGTDGSGVRFADAIEFDHTGEFLIYDAYNVINSNFGEDISYWDIGFIKVWDNATNDFGNGNINKLYGTLPENVSIGNPTFSKNSPQIIAFDYFNEQTSEYAILGANLITGDVDVITTSATLGFPSFSKNDDQIAFSALNMSEEEVVATIDLAQNKISAVGSASVIIADAKWPVFYTVGSRSLDIKPIANFTVDLKSGRAPLSVKFIDLSINNPVSWKWTFEGGSPSTSNNQTPSVTYYSQGIYKVSLTCANNAGNNTITKTSYITVSPVTDINQTKEELFSFYPNPTNGILNINSADDYQLKIYSMDGHLLLISENKKEVDIGHFNQGMYILQFEHKGKIFTEKLIKNE